MARLKKNINRDYDMIIRVLNEPFIVPAMPVTSASDSSHPLAQHKVTFPAADMDVELSITGTSMKHLRNVCHNCKAKRATLRDLLSAKLSLLKKRKVPAVIR